MAGAVGSRPFSACYRRTGVNLGGDQYMDASTHGIGELIEQRRLMRVPDHQRDFAWQADDEVTQFLDDVVRAHGEAAAEYFLGLVVLVSPRDEHGWEILDGQQRLATTTMVYAGIREWLHGAGFAADAQKVQNAFIGVSALGEDIDRPRVTLNITDRQAFHDLVVNRANDATLAVRRDAAGRYSSTRRLIEAALECRQRVAALATAAGDEPRQQAQALFDLATYLRDRTTVVVMNVSSTANAYMIFESLNDRGLDLSVLDLVKNHLFGRAAGRLDEVQADWTRMTANLGDREADDFLKVFWTSKYGRIQRGRLFAEWRRRYEELSPAGIVALAAELASAADTFAGLDQPDHEMWAGFSNQARRNIKALAVLGNQQVRPVIMAALRSFTNERVERLLHHLVTLTVRYQTVGRGRTGLLEIAGARVAAGIASGDLRTPQQVWDDIANLVPSDEDFLIDLVRYTEPKAARARYVLAELERTAYRLANRVLPELVPWDDLSLEHVLPRNPMGAAWQREIAAEPEIRDQIWRLGNLCLLTEPANRGVGAAGFQQKKVQLYGGSELSLTRQVAGYEEWSIASIAHRQRALADLAIATWPLP